MPYIVDSKWKSFLPVAPDSDFPIQNLPYGVCQRSGCCNDETFVGVAIGDHVLNLARLEEYGYFDHTSLQGKTVFALPSLNEFMAQGSVAWDEVRETLANLLHDTNPELRDNVELYQAVVYKQDELDFLFPVEIGDYTDFYSSKEHATNVGIMFRGADNALMPNWLHLPVGYHGRSSSIVVSGTNVRRPNGQTKDDAAPLPTFGPCKQLDFELEMGAFIGTGNKLSEPVPVATAEANLFGMVLVNDWSARDIQKWEYVPLGPFLAKNFATSISPWVVPMAALLPFRAEGPVQEPKPLPYLQSEGNPSFDIKLEVTLQSEKMSSPDRISLSNFKYLYWNLAQQIAHHTSSGCNLRTGDLIASGTISGAEKQERGSMLELTWRGTEPLTLSSGEQRRFFEDGDTVTIKGWCENSYYRIGFGEVTAKLLPALTL